VSSADAVAAAYSVTVGGRATGRVWQSRAGHTRLRWRTCRVLARAGRAWRPRKPT
jgi:hypothetical protein